jgi:hypothetical protein
LKTITTPDTSWGPNTKEIWINAESQLTDIGETTYAYDNDATQM